MRETRDRKLTSAVRALRLRETWPSLASLAPDAAPPDVFRLAHRSFDRKWALADARVGDFLRPALWAAHGPRQMYLTGLLTEVLGEGPALTACAHLPDLHHFRGSFGGKHVIPLWRDAQATQANVTSGLLELLSEAFGTPVRPEDLFAYAAALLGSPAYVARFWDELAQPGPRLPLTREPGLFHACVSAGRQLLRLQTFGERGAPEGRPRLEPGRARCMRAPGSTREAHPQTFEYDAARQSLRVGEGEFAPVAREVWNYSVSGLEVLASWLGYRLRAPSGRSSSPLDEIGPECWNAALTDELLELLWALEGTVALEPELARLIERVADGPTLAATQLPAPSHAQRRPPLTDDEPDDDAPDDHGQRRLLND